MVNKDKILRIATYLAKPLAAILLSGIVIAIFAGKISDISRSIKEKRTAAAILQKRVETIGSIKTDFEKIGPANQVSLERVLPTTDDVADIPAAFETVARSSGITNLTQSFGALSPTSFDLKDPNFTISTIDYNGNMTTNVNAFVRFLKNLERTNYLLNISSITLSAPAERGWGSDSSISIRGKLYLKQRSR